MSEAPQAIIDDLIVKRVAACAVIGENLTSIVKSTGLSTYQVKKIMASPEFKELITAMGDEAMNNAKQVIRGGASRLAPEVLRVLTARLKDDDLDAVKVALKILIPESEEKQVGDTTISVVLPGQKKPEIEVKSDVITVQNPKDRG